MQEDEQQRASDRAMPQVYQCREDALRSCPMCGTIAPKRYGNVYVPGRCACEHAQGQRAYQEAVRRHALTQGMPMNSGRGEMTNIRDAVHLQRLPERIFQRLGGVEREEEATRTCTRCGIIKPTRYANGYVPGKCACLLAEVEQQRAQRERLEAWKAQQAARRKQCEKCYTWLGEWSEPSLAGKTFESFEIDLQPTGFLAAYTFAEQVKASENDPTLSPVGNLVLWSSSSWGTGKTHLAAAICNSLLVANIPCLFTTGQNLFNAFGARFDEHHGVNDLIVQAGDTHVLVIDDLDKTYMTQSGYKSTVFFNILNRRYLKHLPTIVTTNSEVQVMEHDIMGLSDYLGPASCSRLKEHGLQILCMEGVDYRHLLSQKKEQ